MTYITLRVNYDNENNVHEDVTKFIMWKFHLRIYNYYYYISLLLIMDRITL